MLGSSLAILVLSASLFQEPPERTVALIFDGQTVILTLSEAEEEYERLSNIRNRTEQQEKGHAALVLALGTIRQDAPQCVNGVRENWFGERFTCGN